MPGGTQNGSKGQVIKENLTDFTIRSLWRQPNIGESASEHYPVPVRPVPVLVPVHPVPVRPVPPPPVWVRHVTVRFHASQMIDDIIAKWPDIKIIDFDQNE